MRILHLTNPYIQSGAYRAALQIHESLIDHGIDSLFFPDFMKYKNGAGTFRHKADRAFLQMYPRRKVPDFFSPAKVGQAILEKVKETKPDILHLHWINGGFISLSTLHKLFSNFPVLVWTFHDFWPFTGGCHLPGNCKKFLLECGSCPLLASSKKKDLSYKIMIRKKEIYKQWRGSFVCPSRYMMNQCQTSTLLLDKQPRLIYNPVNTGVFQPQDKMESRKKFKLPTDAYLILFGACNLFSDVNKGLNDFLNAVKKMGFDDKNVYYVFFGNEGVGKARHIFPENSIFTGFVNCDRDLALLYSAADIFVSFSRQESGPLTAMESISCGTPVVSKRTGIIPEILDHGISAFIMTMDDEDLSGGIQWHRSLTDTEKENLRKELRQKALGKFNPETVASQYAFLYDSLMGK